MNFISLLLVGFGGAFAVVWLIHYIPLSCTFFGKIYSPRLAICKFLGALDAIMTIILVAGAWIGLGTAITGIGMMVYNVVTGIGLSMGVLFVKKMLTPYWQKKYNEKVEEQRKVVISGNRVRVN